jgi:hypothetical protein
VAETLNWFVAFIVIFFVMAIFIAITISLSTSKLITFSDDKKTIEGFELESLSSQETLFAYLNAPVGDSRIVVLFLSSNQAGTFSDEDRKFVRESNKILNKSCNGYMVDVPKGFVIPNTDYIPTKTATAADDLPDPWMPEEEADWSSWVGINLVDKGKLIEIKYRQLRTCG